MSAMSAHPAHLEYLLRLGDNALVLGQRLAEWCGHGPALEEELALTNISLDLIGQARLLLAHAGALEGAGRGEDDLAYFRDETQFRNWTIVELPNGEAPRDDYATTVARNYLVGALQVRLWEALAGSGDATLAAIAARSVNEARAHLRHARDWLVRLGDGTDESHRRVQASVNELWRYTGEMFEADDIDTIVEKAWGGPSLERLEERWRSDINAILINATLVKPEDGGMATGGKAGRHSEHLGYMIAEMQYLQRVHPGASW